MGWSRPQRWGGGGSAGATGHTSSYMPNSVKRWSGRRRQSVGHNFSWRPGVTSLSCIGHTVAKLYLTPPQIPVISLCHSLHQRYLPSASIPTPACTKCPYPCDPAVLGQHSSTAVWHPSGFFVPKLPNVSSQSTTVSCRYLHPSITPNKLRTFCPHSQARPLSHTTL